MVRSRFKQLTYSREEIVGAIVSDYRYLGEFVTPRRYLRISGGSNEIVER